MSQKYKKYKNAALKRLRRSHWLLKCALILVGILKFYLIAVLVSFSPSDPSWSQSSWNDSINNLGGPLGACVADTLFFTFGVLAYALPSLIFFFPCILIAQHNKNYCIDLLDVAIKLIGSMMLLLSSCCLAALYFDDFYHFISGGIVGSALSEALLSWLNNDRSTLVLLCIWIVGFALFSGFLWLSIAEKVGVVTLNFFTFSLDQNRDKKKKKNC